MSGQYPGSLTHRGRVLVVDDDLALAEMLGIVLRGEGFEPLFCADGEQALQSFRDAQPDVVLLDLMLPGRDGIDVCRLIRQESGVPIVMLTAKSDTVDIVAAAHVQSLDLHGRTRGGEAVSLGLQDIGAAAGQDHPRSGAGEGLGPRKADAGAGPGDPGSLSLQCAH